MQAVDGDVGQGAGQGEVAASRFVLPRRTFLLALAGLAVLLALIVAGGVAFNSHSKVQAAERAAAQERARAARAQAVANSADNLAQLEAARRAHQEILETGSSEPAMASVPSPTVEAALPPALQKALRPAPAPVPQAVGKTAETRPAPAKREAAAAAVPAAGCSLGGGNPQDYGKALGRCLEEFNRQEGR